MQIQYSFKRYEKKFLLTEEQKRLLLAAIREKVKPDEYGIHTICNIYYDTDRYDLIRTSVERPAYKEKFRLRSYGVPDADSVVFAEIKKKFDGVVYKRRVDSSLKAIRAFVLDGRPVRGDVQIQREIQWFLHLYCPSPKVFIGYERIAYIGQEDPELRITFDWNIRWRNTKLDLGEGAKGTLILPDNRIVMEVKTPSAIPLWLADILSQMGIYPVSFSKYGICYQKYIAKETFGRRQFYA